MNVTAEPIVRLVEAHPLPAADGDKDERGIVVIVAGSAACPGAALLSAVAALRSGAGRVQILTAPEIAVAIGVEVPESLALGWTGEADERVAALLAKAGAVCIGPGLEQDAPDIAVAALDMIDPATPVILDARALGATSVFADRGQRLVVAPNVTEALNLVSEPLAEQGVAALAAALTTSLRVPVAVRGETTVLANGEAAWWSKGATGLGTAGSGDVLAGIVAAMLARGIDDVAALGWGVATHAAAGRLLAGDSTNPGYLARELLDVIPSAMASLAH